MNCPGCGEPIRKGARTGLCASCRESGAPRRPGLPTEKAVGPREPQHPPQSDAEPQEAATALVSALGRVAGLGGIAVGLALLVFYEVAPAFTAGTGASQAHNLRLFLILTFALSIAGLSAWAHTAGRQGRNLALTLLVFALLMAGLGAYLVRGEPLVIEVISGTVVDDNRQAAIGANISTEGSKPVESAPNGSFQISARRPPSGEKVELIATKDDYRTTQLVDSGSSDVRLVLPMAVISGRVVEDNGQTICGAIISAEGSKPVKSDSDGNFAITARRPSSGEKVMLTATKGDESVAVSVNYGSSNVPLVLTKRSQ